MFERALSVQWSLLSLTLCVIGLWRFVSISVLFCHKCLPGVTRRAKGPQTWGPGAARRLWGDGLASSAHVMGDPASAVQDCEDGRRATTGSGTLGAFQPQTSTRLLTGSFHKVQNIPVIISLPLWKVLSEWCQDPGSQKKMKGPNGVKSRKLIRPLMIENRLLFAICPEALELEYTYSLKHLRFPDWFGRNSASSGMLLAFFLTLA